MAGSCTARRVATVARWGSATANRYPLWCGAVYEARRRVRDGVLTWRRVESFGGTRSGWRPSGLFVRQLKAVAEYPWMDDVRHGTEVESSKPNTSISG